MQAKLTLRLNANLIRRAKAHARRTGKSLSSVVADYFASLDAADAAGHDHPELSPRVRLLLGALRGSDLDEATYRRHLEGKHK